ncbi:uncharacterized protein LOC128216775 isoform X2 [Mya arenaria]|uniref:uncharacterized protein LOC128216775 isoform X2 n=1 Tax=Mya arenaria TaxID=6604 RepID=UPI0022E37D56|nr:uncharacterized protein LOC128216775 isoform X2 [Mya arenaria]
MGLLSVILKCVPFKTRYHQDLYPSVNVPTPDRYITHNRQINEGELWILQEAEKQRSPGVEIRNTLIEKETVLSGPDNDSFINLCPYDSSQDTDNEEETYAFIDEYLKPGIGCEIQERTHYERRTMTFEELIITCVDVKQILPYLTFVEYPQSYRNIANYRSGREATKTLIEDIQKSKELGRWRQFVEALERCGYEYVVKCLKGQHVQDNSCQKQFLKIMSMTIRNYITPTELTPFLWNYGVINDEDKQRIECQQTAHGVIQAADMLLEIIPTKIENWYRRFVDSLVAAKMTDVADLLRIPEIMDIPSGLKSTPGKTELALSNSVPENKCATPDGPKSLGKLSAIIYVPEGTPNVNVVDIQGRTTIPQLFDIHVEEEEYEYIDIPTPLLLAITEGDVHKEEEDNQYSDKGLYSANQLSPTKLGKETTDNEQVTDLPNDFYGQVVKPLNERHQLYKDSAIYMSDIVTMYEEPEIVVVSCPFV